MIPIDPIFARRLHRISLTCALVATAIAAIAMTGWIFHLPRLATIIPGLAWMKVNTSLGLLACGTAMILRTRSKSGCFADRSADALATLAMLIGGLTVLEYATGRNFGIDNLLITDPFIPAHGHQGRMSIATAAAIGLVGMGIFLLDRSARVSQVAVIGGLLIPLLGLLGFSYGRNTLRQTYSFSSMAPHTAVSLCLLAVSNLTARTGRGLIVQLISSSVGGSLVRRMLPAIVLVPLAVGWICLQGQRAHYYETEFGIAIFALATTIILASITWWNAMMLDRADGKRRRIEEDHADLLILEQTARARAEKALLARDQLLSIVSHELRAPLTPALLIVNALEHDSHLPADLREDVHLIHEQIEIEARLIDNLLDMASLNQGKLVLHHQGVDLHETVKAVAAQFSTRLAEQNVAMLTVLSAASPRVLGDRARLIQVLSNLLSNAIKFTPAGGSVRVRTFDTPGGDIALEITDSGVGMTPDVLGRIFDPFEQGDPTTTRQFGGLGIGLAICKRLVQLHGGALSARSDGAGQGATFVVTLPVYREPPSGALPEPARVKRSILLVDDNAQALKSMQVLLGAQGFEIVPVASANEALAAARALPFDLLVSDIGLPDLSGWELMRQLREIGPIQGIAVSGFVDDEDRARSLKCGYAFHLAKPIDINQLRNAIETALGGPVAKVASTSTQ